MKNVLYILLIICLPCKAQLTEVREIKNKTFHIIEDDSLNIVLNDYEDSCISNTTTSTRNPNIILKGKNLMLMINNYIKDIPFVYAECVAKLNNSSLSENEKQARIERINNFKLKYEALQMGDGETLMIKR